MSSKLLNNLFFKKINNKSLLSKLYHHVAYLIYVLATIVVCLFFVDRLILPSLDYFQFLFCSENEIKENEIINLNNKYKVQMDPVWHSKGHHVSLKKKSKRILVMGDSFVWGDGYANMNDLWWRQLEIELLRRGYEDIDVIAAGECGWSTHNQLNHIKISTIMTYKPDIIIWGYVTNDADEQYVKQLPYPQFNAALPELEKKDLILRFLKSKETYLPTLTRLLINLRRQKLITMNSPQEECGYSYTDWELELLKGENIKHYRNTVAELNAFMDSTGIPYFFVTLPSFPIKSYYKQRYDPVFKLFENTHTPYYDLFTSFDKNYDLIETLFLNWYINPANVHPGRRSTSFYAQQVANILEKDFNDILPAPTDTTRTLNRLRINDWIPVSMDIEQNENTISFAYPDDDSLMRRLPHNHSYVQLNLEVPIKISGIMISGKELLSGKLSLIRDNIDDRNIYEIGEKKGNNLTWDLKKSSENAPVRTINIHAEFLNNQHSGKNKIFVKFDHGSYNQQMVSK